MATNILMPALSPTMTEGTLSRWLKHEGDTVKAGDVIAEIETDKATMEVEAVDEGVLGKILVADGTEGVKVNEPIAILVDAGEKVPDAAASKPAAAPAAEKVAEKPAAVPAAPPAPARTETRGNGHDTSPPDAGGERIFASPLARRMAKQAGIELAALKGSGPNGRIVRADIEAAQKGGTAAPQAAAPAAVPVAEQAAAPVAKAVAPTITAPHKLIPHTTMRKVIARRLTEVRQTIPEYRVSMDIELDAILELMGKLNAKAPKERDAPGWYSITINDMMIKAVATTLRREPILNAAWTDDGIAQYDDVDISVAVAIPEGLITPIIRKADQKGLMTISREMKDLAARARAGKLKPEEFQGGSFSISNLGMFGVTIFDAIINPPQSAILAVAAGQKRAVVKNDELTIATIMTCSLTVDHRVADGAQGANWLRAFKRVVEDPLSLML